MSNAEQIAVIGKVANVLDDLQIDYAIGESIASSLYGNVRENSGLTSFCSEQ